MIMSCALSRKDRETIISSMKREKIEIDPAIAEAMTIRRALKLALDLAIDSILVFSNAFIVVNCINGLKFSIVLEPIILDFLMMCNSFKDCTCLYLNRECNKRAHSLDGLCHFVGYKTWLGHYPIDREFPLLDHHDPLSS